MLPSQRTLLVHCFGAVERRSTSATSLIEGGVRVRAIEVEWAQAADQA